MIDANVFVIKQILLSNQAYLFNFSTGEIVNFIATDMETFRLVSRYFLFICPINKK